MKVVILDQDETQRKIVKESLSGQDYSVVEIQDAEKVIQYLKTDKVDLLVVDFEESGSEIEFINHILASNIENYPYIVFITDEEGEFHAIDCLGPIPGDFLVKPVKEKEFQARIQIAERTIALQSRLRQDNGHSDSLALYDHLTNVLNKQAVYERALAEQNRAQREGSQVGLGMLEIVNLAEIHEKNGDEVRDQAVRFVARATRANVRIYDLVGRWIGAKFLILLPNINQEHIEKVMNRIQESITAIRVRVPEGDRLKLDVRIGYSVMTVEEPQPLYVLIEEANKALMEAAKTKQQMIQAFQEMAVD